ncbi:hypothetical protein IMZ48_09700, partial [Candidatus Bathyarchaeota archaeon]|nr:hypothetical protein [Candidatus Bathyarchaeota archaeon]
MDLHHAIPAPDPPSGDSEDGAPEPSAKRLKADGGAVPAKNGTRTTSSGKRKRRSIDREVPDSPTITRRASPSKKRKSAPDAPSKNGDGGGANSSDDGEYRTIPVNTSPPSFKSFNSNSVKKAKRPINYSPIEEAYELPADDEPETFNFSGKPNGKGKAKSGPAPISSRFVFDESDQSSGEETSIPGTVPRSTVARQGKQKVPGREPSELAETEQPVAESLDKESGADLG